MNDTLILELSSCPFIVYWLRNDCLGRALRRLIAYCVPIDCQVIAHSLSIDWYTHRIDCLLTAHVYCYGYTYIHIYVWRERERERSDADVSSCLLPFVCVLLVLLVIIRVQPNLCPHPNFLPPLPSPAVLKGDMAPLQSPISEPQAVSQRPCTPAVLKGIFPSANHEPPSLALFGWRTHPTRYLFRWLLPLFVLPKYLASRWLHRYTWYPNQQYNWYMMHYFIPIHIINTVNNATSLCLQWGSINTIQIILSS